jgi:hypothetical protein
MVVNSELPVTVSVTPSANPFCQGAAIQFTAAVTNGGTSPVYQWKVNGIGMGTNNAQLTYQPIDNDFITCLVHSNLSCASNNPATSNAVRMVMNNSTPAEISITASENPVCPGTMVTFSSIILNGGSNPVYNWKVNGISTGANQPVYQYSPSDGDMVVCSIISNAYCVSGNPATSNEIIMQTVSQLPAGIVITPSCNPICPGTQVTIVATTTNAGDNPFYLWTLNGSPIGGDNDTLICSPGNGDLVQCQLTSSSGCISGANPVMSNMIPMMVFATLPVSATITASANPECQGTSVKFTAAVTNGGTQPVFQWKVNNVNVGTNIYQYTYIPVAGDQVCCLVTSNLVCATQNPALSNVIIMELIPPQPVSVSILPSNNPVCLGLPVSFTATPANGGNQPQYQWRVNGIIAGTNDPSFSYTPSNADAVTCMLTSNASCISANPAISNQVHMTVNNLLPVSVTITTQANPFCEGNSVTFTAIPVNGGTIPVYQWKVNSFNQGSNLPQFTYNPQNGDVVSCLLTSNQTCVCYNPAQSNEISMVQSALLPVSISIASSTDTTCQGMFVGFTATAVNGGSSPAYQWKVNGLNAGINNPYFQYYPSNGDVVTCRLTSSLQGCTTNNPAISNALSTTVFPRAPVSVSVVPSGNPVCQGTAVTFTAFGVNGGTAPVYQWKVNNVPMGGNTTTYSYFPSNFDVVTCKLTSNIICQTGSPATSIPVTMNVSPYLEVSVAIAASSNPVCAGVPVTFSAMVTNGGSAPYYEWRVNDEVAGTSSSAFT